MILDKVAGNRLPPMGGGPPNRSVSCGVVRSIYTALTNSLPLLPFPQESSILLPSIALSRSFPAVRRRASVGTLGLPRAAATAVRLQGHTALQRGHMGRGVVHPRVATIPTSVHRAHTAILRYVNSSMAPASHLV